MKNECESNSDGAPQASVRLCEMSFCGKGEEPSFFLTMKTASLQFVPTPSLAVMG